MSRVSGVSARMSRGCYEETAAVEFQLNAAYTMLLLCCVASNVTPVALAEGRLELKLIPESQ